MCCGYIFFNGIRVISDRQMRASGFGALPDKQAFRTSRQYNTYIIQPSAKITIQIIIIGKQWGYSSIKNMHIFCGKTIWCTHCAARTLLFLVTRALYVNNLSYQTSESHTTGKILVLGHNMIPGNKQTGCLSGDMVTHSAHTLKFEK